MHLLFIFLITMLKIKNAVAPERTDVWVAWNIGQGQWVTHVVSDECRHYDIGGEFGTFNRIRPALVKQCGARLNRLYLSHWDTDHFLNVPSVARTLPNVCWQVRPLIFEEKKAAQKILQLNIPFCDDPIFTKQSAPSPVVWKSPETSETNKSSNIVTDSGVLNSGDSPISVEKQWSVEMPGLERIRVFVAGHHGSRTSSGNELLQRLPALRWVIVSARFAKYGHPHVETRLRLAQRSIPLIQTEVWGNIWFQVRSD